MANQAILFDSYDMALKNIWPESSLPQAAKQGK